MIDKERVRRLSRAGYSTREIGAVVGCTQAYVHRILAREGPAEVAPVTIRAHEGRVTVETDSPQIVGVAIMRALERAGIHIVDSTT